MTTYQRRGRWSYRRVVRMPDGRRLRVSGVPGQWSLPNTKVGAATAEARHVAHTLATGEARPPGYGGPVELKAVASTPTLRSFVDTFMASSGAKNKATTIDAKRQILADHILPVLGDLSIDAVGYAAIEDFKLATLKKVSAKTTNNVLTVLRRMLAVAKKRGLIATVPEIEWMPVERPPFRFLDFPEGDALTAGADATFRAMVLVALRTGLRQGELLGLRWEDVDLPGARLFVRQAIVEGKVTTPKNRKSREVPLCPSALDALKGERHLRGPMVWCDADGRPLTSGACKHPLYRAARRAKIDRIGWHVLRHTFASHLAMREVPIVTIKELMGHATIAMTLRYAHLAPSVPREAVGRLDLPWHAVTQQGTMGPSVPDSSRTPVA